MKEKIEEILSYTADIKLLYVEDNADTRRSTLRLFDEMFPSVTVAVDGEDAWEKYQEGDFSLIITDIEMPHLDGLGFIKRVRSRGDNVSILISSAYDDSSYLTDAIALNIDGYIIKPFVLEQLIDLILKTTRNLFMQQENIRYKESLEKQVALEISKREDKERMLMQQTKMAAMGDMIDAIAHQWKQPLSSISMYMDMLYDDAVDAGSIGHEEIKRYQEDIETQVNHLLTTLHEFRTFFKTDKETTRFSMYSLIQSVLLLMKDELLKNQIETEVIVPEDSTMPGSVNELKHLLINLINNAKDAFNERGIKNRKLIFRVTKDDKLLLEVEDNAGGIPTEVIDTIFNPRTTTKSDDKGSGIGLYVSTQIVEKHHGDLWVENVNDGAKFLAQFPVD
jgi:signal transduction histidine kinase